MGQEADVSPLATSAAAGMRAEGDAGNSLDLHAKLVDRVECHSDGLNRVRRSE